MKNFFNKMKTYSFWVSFSGALIILLNAFGRIFGFQIENQIVEDCVMSIAGILVVLGVVTMNGDNNKNSGDDQQNDSLEEDEKTESIDEENGSVEDKQNE